MDAYRPSRLLPLAALAAALLAGCSSLGYDRPDVSLVDLKFKDLKMFETSGTFTIRVSNPNPNPLRVEGGVYNLYLDGLRIGRGLSGETLEVPPLSSVTIPVELYVSNLAVASRLRSIYKTRDVDYRIKAKIYVRRNLGRRTLTVNRSGRFDFGDVARGSRLDEGALP